jgi:hypothetical protein
MGVLLFLPVMQVAAHSESENAGYPLLDCAHPAPNAATALPLAIGVSANLECTPAFYQIVANEGWTWRYPGSVFERPFIPAYAPRPSQGMGGVRFFTGFEVVELESGEVRSQHEEFARSLPTYRENVAPSRILRMAATNDLGHELSAFFGFRSEREGWVVVCAPDCAPENLFLIEKAE